MIKEENKKLAYRTYVLVLRQLSPINKGVQAEHSSKRFVWKYKNDEEISYVFDPEMPENETTIMLDGGVHQDMVEIKDKLESAGVKFSYFEEPDLNNCLTAITFIADERVWDRKYFKTFQEFYDYFMQFYGTDLQLDTDPPTYNEWLVHIGGEKNALLIEILQNKPLAR